MFGIMYIDEKGKETESKYVFGEWLDVHSYLVMEKGFTRKEDKIYAYYKRNDDDSIQKALVIGKELWAW